MQHGQTCLDAAIGDVADLFAVELGPLLAVQLLHQRHNILRAHLQSSTGSTAQCRQQQEEPQAAAQEQSCRAASTLPVAPVSLQTLPQHAEQYKSPATHHIDERIADVALIFEVDW